MRVVHFLEIAGMAESAAFRAGTDADADAGEDDEYEDWIDEAAELYKRGGGDADEDADVDAYADEDADEDEEDGTPTRPPFELRGPPMKQPPPAGVANAAALDLRTGPMWSVAAAALEPAALLAHIAALTCVPRERGGVRRTAAQTAKLTFFIGRVVGARLVMPPWYARLAFVAPYEDDADDGAVSEKTKPRKRTRGSGSGASSGSGAGSGAGAGAGAGSGSAKRLPSGLTRGEAMRVGVTFAGKLFVHPPQQQALKRYIEWLGAHTDCPSCVVSLPCGYGKTVWFLALAHALQRVTLVLTHKLPLVDQWVNEARAFLPGARVGYVTADDARVDGVDVIVASIHSLRSHIEKRKPYVDVLFARVGLVCLDEGHHAVASTFASVLAVVPAQYRVVLTATPRRKDGLLPQLQWVAGPVIFQAFRRVGEVHVLALQYEDVGGRHPELRRGKVLLNASMVTALTEDAVRTELAVAVITMLATQQRRRVLVVTPRVEHVHVLAASIAAQLELEPHATDLARRVSIFVPDARPKRPRGRARPDDAAWAATLHAWEDSGPHGAATEMDAPLVGCVLQGMSGVERALAYEGCVVVTTSQMMEEGISYKQWDTLVDLDNTSDPEQVVGRILRACENKRVPLIVDMWIDVSLFRGLFWKRWRMYKAEGFTCRRMRASCAADALADANMPVWEHYNRIAPPVW